MFSVGTILGDRYKIKEKIGAGGMSIVYKAKCQKLQRYVAVKVLREEFAKDAAFVASFRDEALSAASLSHPNIVGIYDVGQEKGAHYIVMEYVEGKTLKELIEEKAPYSNKIVLEYGMEIVSAIRHAHAKRIIHRDIKPQNILVTNDHILKVTDFGIARAVDSSTLVSTGSAIGSVHYFSPEQARGKHVDETSDLYSCGIVLYELATGRLPFEADSHVTVALKHINEEIPLATSFNQEISPTLEAIILKATQKRSKLRYQNADDMFRDMQRLSEDPSYEIVRASVDHHQETILMTPEETDFIRNNSKINDELTIPSWQKTNPGSSSALKKKVEKEDEDEETTATYNLMVTIAGVLAAMVLIGIVAAFALPWFGKFNKPEVAVVPGIIGQNVEIAIEELVDLGLKLKVVREEEREELPEGEIIRQAPEKDDLAPLGSEVEVIISKHPEIIEPEEVIVPNVTGIDFIDAQTKLDDLELRVKVERQSDDKVEDGIVISQYPMSRNKLKPGETVTLIVSQGPEIVTIIVPNVLNMDESTGIATLQRAGVNVGNIDHEESDDIGEGRIISQSVPANSKIEQSKSVSIVISKGKKEEEPEKEEEEEPIPSPPTETVRNLVITIPSFVAKKEDYQILIRLLNENGTAKTIYEGMVQWDQFPLSIDVKGTGKGTVETYIDSEPVYADPIDFNEVNQ